MNEPRAVEIVHVQTADSDGFEIRGYWAGDCRGKHDTKRAAEAAAVRAGYIICTRPQPREKTVVKGR